MGLAWPASFPHGRRAQQPRRVYSTHRLNCQPSRYDLRLFLGQALSFSAPEPRCQVPTDRCNVAKKTTVVFRLSAVKRRQLSGMSYARQPALYPPMRLGSVFRLNPADFRTLLSSRLQGCVYHLCHLKKDSPRHSTTSPSNQGIQSHDYPPMAK